MKTSWIAAISLLALGHALALDPTLSISQYGHSAWRLREGALAGAPHVMAQTIDGYLWIGTEAGLVRFDGVRFVPWNPPSGKLQTSIFSLLAANDGSLWIGTANGLMRWQNGQLITYANPRGRIAAIAQDKNGTVWITRTRPPDAEGGLCRVSGAAPRCYGKADGMPFIAGSKLANDSAGNLWVGSSSGICRWSAGKAACFIPPEMRKIDGLSGVSGIAPAAGGTVWVSITRAGRDLGLQKLVDGSWADYAIAGLDRSRLDPSGLRLDRDGALWIGTNGHGIYRVHDGKADHYDASSGITGDSVDDFYEDREGNFWVLTSEGVDEFRDVDILTFTRREGLTADLAGSVLGLRDGSVWVGNHGALDVIRGGIVSAIGPRDGLPGQRITSLFQDRSGQIWTGVDRQLTLFQHGRFTRVLKLDGSDLGVVISMAEDNEENLWALSSPDGARRSHLFRIHNHKVLEEAILKGAASAVAANILQPGVWLVHSDGSLEIFSKGEFHTYPRPPSAQFGVVHDTFLDPDGAIWAATSKGLFRWNGKDRQTLDSRNGLPCDELASSIKDNQGSLWVQSLCGIYMIPASELAKWSHDSSLPLRIRSFDRFDGARPGGRNPFTPRASRSQDGRLWFVNEYSVQVVDPLRLRTNTTPPPVHVEGLIADRKTYPTGENLRLPPLTRDIQISYTALSFTVPQKVQFRYKLEGHDRDWRGPETRREAFYNDLPPGSYRFHVIASNNDGIWNDAGAQWSFSIAPAYYQTNWFRVLVAAGAISLLWSLYRLRVRVVAAGINAQFNERLAERTRIARELHDTLLQDFLGASLQAHAAYGRLEENSPAKQPLGRALELIERANTESRITLRGLRSSRYEPLTLEQQFASIPSEIGIGREGFAVRVEGRQRDLQPAVIDDVFRIVREAIVNALTHSGAKSIQVEVQYTPSGFRAVVQDNGCGIQPDVLHSGRKDHWGLRGIRERAEKIGAGIKVFSTPGAGTEVILSVPSHVAFKPQARGKGTWFLSTFRAIKAPTNSGEKTGV